MATEKNSIEVFYGIVSLEPSLGCTSSALGCRAPIKIGGVEGTLELPSPAAWGIGRPDDPLRIPLTAPVAAATWKVGDVPLFWGFPVRYPDGWAEVEKMLLTFHLPLRDMSVMASRIHRGFTRWYELFNQYFDLVTKQRSLPSIEVAPYPGELDLFRWGSDRKVDYPYAKEVPSIAISVANSDELLLKPDQFRSVCDLASSLRDPALPYRVQLEAYRAARSGDFRKALVETGSAAELGLTQASRDIMNASGIAFADELMKRFQALGGKLELARMLGVSLPSIDYKAKLVTPRNCVIHRGDFAGKDVALDAIRVTDDLLKAICPSLQDLP
jgi:hypothetical protein